MYLDCVDTKGRSGIQTCAMINTLFLVTLCVWAVQSQFYECPDDWVAFDAGQRCYKFKAVPTARYDAAVALCLEEANSAYVLSINDAQEHTFISDWLTTQDIVRRVWYTSGIRDPSNPSYYRWDGDGTNMRFDLSFWNNNGQQVPGNMIGYAFNGVSYGWQHVFPNASLSYICEISQQDAYTILTQKRDFSYGVDSTDKKDILYGPTFTVNPTDVTMISKTTSLFVECRASSNPPAAYKWYRGPQSNQTLITPLTDVRYTMTNGKLSIQAPVESDEGQYRCKAENEFGVIISHPVNIDFGYLGEFSNVENAPVRSLAYEGAVIVCSQINVKPAATYNWRKQSPGSYKRDPIYTLNNPHIFISNNGRLYFTEATKVDEADYFCEVTLNVLDDQNAIGSSQAPSRISKRIPLEILNQAAKTDWGPVIHTDFIEVFPKPPLRGHKIRMECFAYGSVTSYTQTWSFTWNKVGGRMPDRAKYLDFNRVVEIGNIQYEDEGTYECVVKRKSSVASKVVLLSIESKPYFLIPLDHKHLDEGVETTWRCLAYGKPSPTYTWYKNGQLLQPNNNADISINRNILTIRNANKEKHDGMYQCAATNTHGTSLSAAQVRILAFQPTFQKNRLPESIDAALNGEVVIPCEPEGAPRPEITWIKNNVAITGDSRVRIMPNNFLKITNINYGDQGFYECRAKNIYGSDGSFCRLNVKVATTITRPPDLKTEVYQNKTALIYCTASYDPSLDLVYAWSFSGKIIDVQRDAHYELANLPSGRGLYIKMAQFYHQGMYECIARTPLNEARAKGDLAVYGPPGEVSGLYADPGTPTTNSIDIFFFPGTNHGFEIEYFIVEFEIQSEKGKWYHSNETTTVFAPTTIIPGNKRDMRTITVRGLYPGNGYSFRIKAVNIQGVGPPCIPSSTVNTLDAAPAEPPANLSSRTDGVSVGQLMITWKQLPRKYHGAQGVTYILYYRLLKFSSAPDALWSKVIIQNWKQEEVVIQVGEDFYWRQYETKIQAKNGKGTSHNSSIVIVYSSMGIPVAVPTNIWGEGYNSTALLVHWNPVPDTREEIKGKLGGYQVNYYLRTQSAEDTKDFSYKRSIRFHGQVNSGIVIGLDQDTYYYVEAQVFTDAGLGPLGERNLAETMNPAPSLYPQEVKVVSKDASSVIISWRGVSTGPYEDSLKGYKIFVWKANEHFRTANPIDVFKFPTEYTVTGIEKDFVYAVRVAGYSYGGIGRKSPTLYFTLAGSRVPIDTTITQQLLAGGSKILPYNIIYLSLVTFILRIITLYM
ncbi:contactin-5-like isoform X2 [Ostrea edulis]|uniref:contactin-5-like isoform X2 n=1 Tax=Ostrea edulis TaxID=37623 RepID=UPI0024AFD843|nr:contactin-5-like isoform X2 [Ostrea edulis]